VGPNSTIANQHRTKKLGMRNVKGRRVGKKELADKLRKPINFTRQRVIVNHIDELWCADLVEMQQFSKWNKGYRYLLMVLDVFSKYSWIVPLKNKKGKTVTEAFAIFKTTIFMG